MDDEIVDCIIEYLGSSLANRSIPEQLTIRKHTDIIDLVKKKMFVIIDNALYYKTGGFVAKVVKRSTLHKLLTEHHGVNHINASKLYSLLVPKYYWNGMNKDIQSFIKMCIVCNPPPLPTNHNNTINYHSNYNNSNYNNYSDNNNSSKENNPSIQYQHSTPVYSQQYQHHYPEVYQPPYEPIQYNYQQEVHQYQQMRKSQEHQLYPNENIQVINLDRPTPTPPIPTQIKTYKRASTSPCKKNKNQNINIINNNNNYNYNYNHENGNLNSQSNQIPVGGPVDDNNNVYLSDIHQSKHQQQQIQHKRNISPQLYPKIQIQELLGTPPLHSIDSNAGPRIPFKELSLSNDSNGKLKRPINVDSNESLPEKQPTKAKTQQSVQHSPSLPKLPMKIISKMSSKSKSTHLAEHKKLTNQLTKVQSDKEELLTSIQKLQSSAPQDPVTSNGTEVQRSELEKDNQVIANILVKQESKSNDLNLNCEDNLDKPVVHQSSPTHSPSSLPSQFESDSVSSKVFPTSNDGDVEKNRDDMRVEEVPKLMDPLPTTVVNTTDIDMSKDNSNYLEDVVKDYSSSSPDEDSDIYEMEDINREKKDFESNDGGLFSDTDDSDINEMESEESDDEEVKRIVYKKRPRRSSIDSLYSFSTSKQLALNGDNMQDTAGSLSNSKSKLVDRSTNQSQSKSNTLSTRSRKIITAPILKSSKLPSSHYRTATTKEKKEYKKIPAPKKEKELDKELEIERTSKKRTKDDNDKYNVKEEKEMDEKKVSTIEEDKEKEKPDQKSPRPKKIIITRHAPDSEPTILVNNNNNITSLESTPGHSPPSNSTSNPSPPPSINLVLSGNENNNLSNGNSEPQTNSNVMKFYIPRIKPIEISRLYDFQNNTNNNPQNENNQLSTDLPISVNINSSTMSSNREVPVIENFIKYLINSDMERNRIWESNFRNLMESATVHMREANQYNASIVKELRKILSINKSQ